MIDLRTTREQLGLSRREAGSVLGLAESQVYNIEAGIRKNSVPVNANTAHQLANRLRLAKGEQRCNCCGRIRPKSDFQRELTSFKKQCKNCRNGVQLYEGMKISWSQMIKMELPDSMKAATGQIKKMDKQGVDYPIVMHLALRKHGWGRHETAARLGVAFSKVKQFVNNNWLADEGRVYEKLDPADRCMSIGEAHYLMWTHEKKQLRAAKAKANWSYHPDFVNWRAARYAANQYANQTPETKARRKKAAERYRRKQGHLPRAMATLKRYGDSMHRKARKRVALNLRRKTVDAYKRGAGNYLHWLGCTGLELREWLEHQFKRGMTHDNYGTYWNIDHITPLASFNLSDPQQYLIAANYCNLQPMKVMQNSLKGATTDGQMQLVLQSVAHQQLRFSRDV